MSSLSGLYGVEWIGGDLSITENPALSAEEIEVLIEAVGEENIGGEIELSEGGL